MAQVLLIVRHQAVQVLHFPPPPPPLYPLPLHQLPPPHHHHLNFPRPLAVAQVLNRVVKVKCIPIVDFQP